MAAVGKRLPYTVAAMADPTPTPDAQRRALTLFNDSLEKPLQERYEWLADRPQRPDRATKRLENKAGPADDGYRPDFGRCRFRLSHIEV